MSRPITTDDLKNVVTIGAFLALFIGGAILFYIGGWDHCEVVQSNSTHHGDTMHCNKSKYSDHQVSTMILGALICLTPFWIVFPVRGTE